MDIGFPGFGRSPLRGQPRALYLRFRASGDLEFILWPETGKKSTTVGIEARMACRLWRIFYGCLGDSLPVLALTKRAGSASPM